jgi:hypothetical protein
MTKQEKARWLLEIYTAVAEGRTVQYVVDGTWLDQSCGPDMISDPEYWRIKPEPPEPREHEAVVHRSDCTWVQLPNDWPEGTKVRVTEIIE